MRYLAAHPGWIVSQEELYQAVWKEEPANIKGAVYCTISSLRKKLKAHTCEEYIQTVPGMGSRPFRAWDTDLTSLRRHDFNMLICVACGNGVFDV